jgi:pimeloyl-ACP methyl ester carboxylesterase
MGPEIHELSIPRGARTLSARLVRLAADTAAGTGLLFVHGLRSDQSGYRDRAEAAAAAISTTCLTFDLSGHGESTGDLDAFSPRDHLGDVLAAYDFLAGQDDVDVRRIGICAASYGAYLAARSTSLRPVQRLLLRAPALYADADFDTPIRNLRSMSDGASSEILLASLAEYRGDVLVLESEMDEVIERATVEAYVSAFEHISHRVIPEATHALVEPAWRAAFVDFIVLWFEKL